MNIGDYRDDRLQQRPSSDGVHPNNTNSKPRPHTSNVNAKSRPPAKGRDILVSAQRRNDKSSLQKIYSNID